jgi:predicted nucleotidyltransferase
MVTMKKQTGSAVMGSAHVDLQLLVSRREAILAAARRRGADNVRVFGSVARGDADAGSDVDLLVDLEPGRSLFDLGGLLMDLEEVIGAPVDLVTEKGLRPRLRERVLREAVSL